MEGVCAAFAKAEGPKYAGVILTPFRLRPLYRQRDGKVLVISSRFMLATLPTLRFRTTWVLPTTVLAKRAKLAKPMNPRTACQSSVPLVVSALPSFRRAKAI